MRWRFTDPPNLAVIVDKRILSENMRADVVFHDAEDGGWQFLVQHKGQLTAEQAAVVSLRQMLEIDPTLAEIADLSPGWYAWRQGSESSWQRAKTP